MFYVKFAADTLPAVWPIDRKCDSGEIFGGGTEVFSLLDKIWRLLTDIPQVAHRPVDIAAILRTDHGSCAGCAVFVHRMSLEFAVNA